MRPLMPEQPSVRSWFEYGFLKGLKERLPPNEYDEFVKRWNSRRMTGRRDGRPSSESSNE